MSNDFLNAIIARRSKYAISRQSTISDEKIIEIVQEAVKYTPTAFNSQSGRSVLLLGEQHNKLWDITIGALRKVVPPENFAQTEEKINSFKNGYGTVLFFEDQSIVEGLQAQFPLYKDNFPVWSLEAQGMLQYITWTLLDSEGLGVTLQHYNPLIDDELKKQWNIPGNWKLLGQMPFGKPTAPAAPKEFKPLEERVKVFK